MATQNVNSAEQQRIAALNEQRASQLLSEAANSQTIADRDEKVVAGEDTETAAVNAANTAKSQLGSAAGKGAAALAGAQAAQETRNSRYSELLAQARQRKDTKEQQAVDRRNAAIGRQGTASGIRQQSNLDDQQAQFLEEREEALKKLSDNATFLNDRDKAIENERGKIPETEQAQADGWGQTPLGEDVPEGSQPPPSIPSSATDDDVKVINQIAFINKSLRATTDETARHTYTVALQKLIDKLSPSVRDFHDWTTYYSDERLKNVKEQNSLKPNKGIKYEENGPNAGKKGDAKRSAEKNIKKAKAMWKADDLPDLLEQEEWVWGGGGGQYL